MAVQADIDFSTALRPLNAKEQDLVRPPVLRLLLI